MAQWDSLRARLAPPLQATLTAAKLQALAPAGKCKPPSEPVRTPSLGTRTFLIACEPGAIGLALTVGADGLVGNLQVVAPPAPVTVVTGPYQLPAQLTLPAGAGPFPAAVLVHGSGPNDMDETIGPNKPFRDIANGLAAHGIATLRYTKRTRQYGASLPKDITLREETVDDALSAVQLLRRTPGIDGKRIFVIGHSLGAFAAPRIAAADAAIAGVVLLAGNTRPVDVLLDEQIKYLGGKPEQAAAIKKSMPEAYWKDLAVNPVPLAASIRTPMLILQGERDYQVTMEDFKGWKAIESARVTCKSYPAMNHLFQPGQGKAKPSEYQMVAPFSPVVIDDIARWMRQ